MARSSSSSAAWTLALGCRSDISAGPLPVVGRGPALSDRDQLRSSAAAGRSSGPPLRGLRTRLVRWGLPYLPPTMIAGLLPGAATSGRLRNKPAITDVGRRGRATGGGP